MPDPFVGKVEAGGVEYYCYSETESEEEIEGRLLRQQKAASETLNILLKIAEINNVKPEDVSEEIKRQLAIKKG